MIEHQRIPRLISKKPKKYTFDQSVLISNHLILKSILHLLEPKTICIFETLSKQWNKIITELDEFYWKPKCQYIFQFQQQTLPLSYKTWKHLFGCLFHMDNGIHDFMMIDNKLHIPSGSWKDIEPRTLHSVPFKKRKYNTFNSKLELQQQITREKGKRRYITVIPCIDAFDMDVCLFDNYIYLVDDRDESQATLFGINLENPKMRKALHGHLNPIRKFKCSQLGYLVSLDSSGMFLIWDLKNITTNKPMSTLNLLTNKFQGIKSFDVYQEYFAILFQCGKVIISEIKTGKILSLLSISYVHAEYLESSQDISVIIRESCLSIVFGDGQNLVFERRLSTSNSEFKYQYFMVDNPIVDVDQLLIYNGIDIASEHIIQTNNSSQKLILACISRPFIGNRLSNMYHMSKAEFYALFNIPIRPKLTKCATLSVPDSMKRFGINTETQCTFRQVAFEPDQSMILAVGHYPSVRILCVWDFRVHRAYDRYFERIQIGTLRTIWACYDLIPDPIQLEL